jgi:hypothetical protein
MKHFSSAILILIVLVGGGASFLSSLSFPDTSYNFLGETKRVELSPGQPVTQVFSAMSDRLERIKIVMGDTHLGLTERIEFALLDATCSVVLRSATRHWYTPEPRIFTSFDFEPLVESAGQRYCLSLTYVSSARQRKDRPFIAASEGGAFASMSYTDAGKGRTYEHRSLHIRPSYGEATITGRLWQLENRLSQYKPAIVKGYMLLLGGVGIAGAIILMFVFQRSMREDTAD